MKQTKTVTVDFIRKVHTILEACNGNLKDAATILNLRDEQMKGIIEDHPELKSYLPGARPINKAEAISRPPLVTPVTQEELEIADAMRKAELEMENSLAAIGCKPNAVKQAMAFQKFGVLHFKGMRHMIGGGIAKLYTDLFVEREVLIEEIKAVGGGDNERERILREDLSRLNDHIIKVYDRALEAWRIQAKIDAAKAEAKEKASKLKHQVGPAFSPLATEPPKKRGRPPVLEAVEIGAQTDAEPEGVHTGAASA